MKQLTKANFLGEFVLTPKHLWATIGPWRLHNRWVYSRTQSFLMWDFSPRFITHSTEVRQENDVLNNYNTKLQATWIHWSVELAIIISGFITWTYKQPTSLRSLQNLSSLTAAMVVVFGGYAWRYTYLHILHLASSIAGGAVLFEQYTIAQPFQTSFCPQTKNEK